MFKILFSILLLFIAATKTEIQCPSTEILLNGHCQPMVAELYCNEEKCGENMKCDELNRCKCLEGFLEYSDLEDSMKKKCEKNDDIDYSLETVVWEQLKPNLTIVEGSGGNGLLAESVSGGDPGLSENGDSVSSSSIMSSNNGETNDSTNQKEIQLATSNHSDSEALPKSAASEGHFATTVSDAADLPKVQTTAHTTQSTISTELISSSTNSSESTQLYFATTPSNFVTDLSSSTIHVSEEESGNSKEDSIEENTDVSENGDSVSSGSTMPLNNVDSNDSQEALNSREEENLRDSNQISETNLQEIQSTSKNRTLFKNAVSNDHPAAEDLPDDTTNTGTTQSTISIKLSSSSTDTSESPQLFSATTPSNIVTDLSSSTTDTTQSTISTRLTSSSTDSFDSSQLFSATSTDVDLSDDNTNTYTTQSTISTELSSSSTDSSESPQLFSATTPSNIVTDLSSSTTDTTQSTISTRLTSSSTDSSDSSQLFSATSTAEDLSDDMTNTDTDTTQSTISTEFSSSSTDYSESSQLFSATTPSNVVTDLSSSTTDTTQLTISTELSSSSTDSSKSPQLLSATTPSNVATDFFSSPTDVSEEESGNSKEDSREEDGDSVSSGSRMAVTNGDSNNSREELNSREHENIQDPNKISATNLQEIQSTNKNHTLSKNTVSNDHPATSRSVAEEISDDKTNTDTTQSTILTELSSSSTDSYDSSQLFFATTSSNVVTDLSSSINHASEEASGNSTEDSREENTDVSENGESVGSGSTMPPNNGDTNDSREDFNSREEEDIQNVNQISATNVQITNKDHPATSRGAAADLSYNLTTNTTQSTISTDPLSSNSSKNNANNPKADLTIKMISPPTPQIEVLEESLKTAEEADSHSAIAMEIEANSIDDSSISQDEEVNSRSAKEATVVTTHQSTTTSHITEFEDKDWQTSEFRATESDNTTQKSLTSDLAESSSITSSRLSPIADTADYEQKRLGTHANSELIEDGEVIPLDIHSVSTSKISTEKSEELDDEHSSSNGNSDTISNKQESPTYSLISKELIGSTDEKYENSGEDSSSDSSAEPKMKEMLIHSAIIPESNGNDSVSHTNTSESNGRNDSEPVISSYNTKIVEFARANNSAGNQLSERYSETPKLPNTEGNPESGSKESTVDQFVDDIDEGVKSETHTNMEEVSAMKESPVDGRKGVTEQEAPIAFSKDVSESVTNSSNLTKNAAVEDSSTQSSEASSTDFSENQNIAKLSTTNLTEAEVTNTISPIINDEEIHLLLTTTLSTDDYHSLLSNHSSEMSNEANEIYMGLENNHDDESPTSLGFRTSAPVNEPANADTESDGSSSESIINEDFGSASAIKVSTHAATSTTEYAPTSNDESTTLATTDADLDVNQKHPSEISSSVDFSGEVYSSATTQSNGESSANHVEVSINNEEEYFTENLNPEYSNSIDSTTTEPIRSSPEETLENYSSTAATTTDSVEPSANPVEVLNEDGSEKYKPIVDSDINPTSKEFSNREDIATNSTTEKAADENVAGEVTYLTTNNDSNAEASSAIHIKYPTDYTSKSPADINFISKEYPKLEQNTSTHIPELDDNGPRREESSYNLIEDPNQISGVMTNKRNASETRVNVNETEISTSREEREQVGSAIQETNSTDESSDNTLTREESPVSTVDVNIRTEGKSKHNAGDMWDLYSNSDDENKQTIIETNESHHKDDAQDKTKISTTDASLVADRKIDNVVPDKITLSDFSISGDNEIKRGSHNSSFTNPAPNVKQNTHSDEIFNKNEEERRTNATGISNSAEHVLNSDETSLKAAEQKNGLDEAVSKSSAKSTAYTENSKNDQKSNNLQVHATVDTWTTYSSPIIADNDESTVTSVPSTYDDRQENDSTSEKPAISTTKYKDDGSATTELGDESNRISLEELTNISQSESEYKLVGGQRDRTSKIGVNTDSQSDQKSSNTQAPTNIDTWTPYSSSITTDNDESTVASVSSTFDGRRENDSSSKIPAISTTKYKDDGPATTEMADESSRKSLEEKNNIYQSESESKFVEEQMNGTSRIDVNTDSQSNQKSNNPQAPTNVDTWTPYSSSTTDDDESTIAPVSSTFDGMREDDSTTTYLDNGPTTTEMGDESSRSSLGEQANTSQSESESNLVEGHRYRTTGVGANTDSQSNQKSNNPQAHTTVVTWTTYSSSTTDNNESTVASVSSTFDGRAENDSSSEKPAISTTKYKDNGPTMEDESSRSSLIEKTTSFKKESREENPQTKSESTLMKGQMDRTLGIDVTTDSQTASFNKVSKTSDNLEGNGNENEDDWNTYRISTTTETGNNDESKTSLPTTTDIGNEDESTTSPTSTTTDAGNEDEYFIIHNPNKFEILNSNSTLTDSEMKIVTLDARRPHKVVTTNYSNSKENSSLPMTKEAETLPEEKLRKSNDIGNHIKSKYADVAPIENKDVDLTTEMLKITETAKTTKTTNGEANVANSSLASTLTNSSQSAKVIPEAAEEPKQYVIVTWASMTSTTKYNSEEYDAVSKDTTTQPLTNSQLTTTKSQSAGNNSENSDEENIKQASSDIIKHKPGGAASNGTKTASPNSRLTTILLTNIDTTTPRTRRRPIVNLNLTTTLRPHLNNSVLITESGNILIDLCLNTNDKCSKICCGNNTICSVTNGCLCLEGFAQRVQKSTKGIYCVPGDEVAVTARAPVYYIIIGVGCLGFAVGYFSVRYFHLLRIGGRNNVV